MVSALQPASVHVCETRSLHREGPGVFFYPWNYSPSFAFGSAGWRVLHPTQPHAGELYASVHTQERKKKEKKKKRKYVALCIRAGAGKLKKTLSETPPNQDMHLTSQYGITPYLAHFTPSTGLILAVRWTEKGSFILRRVHVHDPASSLTEEEETQSYVPAFKSSEPSMSPKASRTQPKNQ